MSKPIIAVPADTSFFQDAVWHAAQQQYVGAALNVAGAMSFIIPAFEEGNDIDALLDRVDGVLITGARSNVHPSLYGKEATEKDGPFDPGRDANTLPLIRRAIERAMPLLCICRGIQELNVALGGTLVSEVQELEGRIDHRQPAEGNRDDAFVIRQPVTIAEGSCLAGVVDAGEIQVNSLHRQAISDVAPNLSVEATAPDGTVEAVSVIGAKNFAVGVQWHPEYWASTDAPSRKIFEAFGDAVRAYRAAAKS
ncbi:gamma-glutamyl-gamma-aminobutyrate hydrolase family protein [Martelella mediterranea]|uniref:gamma-glutamyl-gamma-aminobutyrate hydrolase n=1 Tax=Martelella mediterranea TaxID=293089 RepID=A0A4R3NXP5_9HYPH|nr:gamma-glutamyl-gamma-aminobutyrate hydrolase family protein [Martelella mediterranea]TCT45027.1 gamma-glutamyl-gamma-aminobutyrate hydrolase [Martelella mediterranea]